MRIISNFSDYYDYVAATGLDKDTVFVRRRPQSVNNGGYKNNVLVKDRQEGPRFKSWVLDKFSWLVVVSSRINKWLEHEKTGKAGWHSRAVVVGFCGKAYPVLLLVDGLDRIQQAYATRSGLEAQLPQIALTEQRMFYRVVEVPEVFEGLSTPNRWAFEVLGTPVWAYWIEQNKAILDTEQAFWTSICLRDLDFSKYLIPEQAFQEIHWFIANFLKQKHEPPLKIADTIRLEQHGFDRHRSFRRPAN